MLIAIEGPTGIGKSTLQGILASTYQAETLIINFEKHPYFEVPHLKLEDYVLEREMIFMLMGYHHLKNIDATNTIVISDFLFDRFLAFAATALPQEDFQTVFYPCYHNLRKILPKPDLVIRLVASPSFILSRIQQRNRSGEGYVTADYLRRLEQALSSLFEDAKDYNIVTINSEQHDFVNDLNARQNLEVLIEAALPVLRDSRSS